MVGSRTGLGSLPALRDESAVSAYATHEQPENSLVLTFCRREKGPADLLALWERIEVRGLLRLKLT